MRLLRPFASASTRRTVTRGVTAALVVALIAGNVPLRIAREIGAPFARTFSEVAAAATAGANTTRVSVNSSGAAGTSDSRSFTQNMSSDGRYVVFASSSANFPGANGQPQIYLRDRTAGTTTLVSVNQGGTVAANGGSSDPQITSDGRFVEFTSCATDLVAGDTNGFCDAFVRDLQTSTTVAASVGSGGFANNHVLAAHIAAGGGYVVFETNATNLVGDNYRGVFLRNLTSGTTTRISHDSGGQPAAGIMSAISANGQYIAFYSVAIIVPGVCCAAQIYLWSGGTNVLVTYGTGSGGDRSSDWPAVANDGSVIFETTASNLGVGGGTGVDFNSKSVRYSGGGLSLLPLNFAGDGYVYITADGRFITFYGAGDQNQAYLYDAATGGIELVSISDSGELANIHNVSGAVSDDGRYVSFISWATNLVPGKANPVGTAADVFVRDRGDQDFGIGVPYTFGDAPYRAVSRDPVNLATGVFTAGATDLSMPGRLLNFGFTRAYNSADTMSGPLGPGWTHSYNWRVQDAGFYVDVRRGDGRRDRYTPAPLGGYLAPPSVFDTLVKNADHTYTFTLTNQVVYQFGTTGSLTRISEPAGNQIQLAYTGSNLTTITDSVGRTITLHYPTGSSKMDYLQDGLGRKTTYAYDTSGRLSTVVDKIGNGPGPAAQHQWTYAYDGTTVHLTTITDPDGRVRVTNTYDSQGRVYQQRDGKNALTTLAYTAPTSGPDPTPFRSQANTVGGTDASSVTVNKPAGVVDGDLLVAFVETQGLNEYKAIAAPAGWTRVGAPAQELDSTLSPGNTLNLTQGAFYRVAASEGASYVFNFSGATNNLARLSVGAVLAYQNGAAVTPIPIWVSSGDDTRNAAQNYGPTTANANDQLVVSLAAVFGAVGGWSAGPAALTDRTGDVVSATGSNDVDLRVWSAPVAAGFPSGTATHRETTIYSSHAVLLRTGKTVVTDPRGHATTYTFDSRMRTQTQTDLVDTNTYVVANTYDAAGNRIKASDRNNAVTDFTYDARGNVLTKLDPRVSPQIPRYLTQYQYDTKNNLAQVTDARNFITTMGFDATTNLLQSVTQQIDVTTSAVTKYEYGDAANPGMPTKVISPDGNLTGSPDYTYATLMTYVQGNLTSRTDPDLAQTTYAYDSVGRLTSSVDPEGNVAGGSAADHTWTIAYDENDRETRRTDPLGNAVVYAYNGSGDLTSLTDRRGNATTYIYDANARLTTVQQKPDPVGNPTLIYSTVATLDGNGNASSVTQANGVVTDYGFDALDRLTSFTTHPDAQTSLTTSSVLDGNGQNLTRTTPDAVTVTNTYDALSRLISVAAPGLTTISFTYDELSRRTQMIDGTGTTTYQYDGLSRSLQVAAPGGTINYGYDRDSNRTSLQYPSSQSVNYIFTKGGRLDHLTDWASRISTYTYRASGLVNTLTYPNGMQALYGYDRAERLTSIADLVGTTTLNRQVYGLDGEGNRTSLDEFVQGITTAPSVTWTASTQVNAVGTGVQDHPAIALGNETPAPATYLVWDDARSGNADIYFSKRDPTTGIWGANVKVNTDTGTRVQINPALAVDSANNVYAVWEDSREGANNKIDTNIYSSKRQVSNGTWLANVRVNDDVTGNPTQRNPRIAGTAAGMETAVWVDLRSSQINIYSSQLTTPGGTSWQTPNKKITDNTAAAKDFPDVAVGSDGTAYAVWQDSRNGNADIYFAKLAPGGAAWTTPNVKVSDDPGTAAQTNARIGVDGAGNLTVVWLDARTSPAKIRVSRQLAGTTTWSTSSIVTDAAARPLSVALSVRSDGKVYVAFHDNRGTSFDVYGAEYDPWTGLWSTSTLVSDDPAAAVQQSPAIAYSSGELMAAWRDDRSGNADVRARRATLTGTDHSAYAYDGLNRLTAVTGPVAESFTLDSASNISSRTGPTHTYTYDTANRITKLDGANTYTWSTADRLTNRGSDTFGYDALGRLTSSTVASSSRAFGYNGDGLLQTSTPGSSTPYLWSGGALVKAGTDTLVYGLAPLYGVRSDASTYTFARDGLGSVRAEVGSAGTVSKSFRYATYGEITSAPSGNPSLLGFAGELLDTNGLVYLRARWYDPVAARFISSDPAAVDPGAASSSNAYAYAGANPVMQIDPSGLSPQDLGWQDPPCSILPQFGKCSPEVVLSDDYVAWLRSLQVFVTPGGVFGAGVSFAKKAGKDSKGKTGAKGTPPAPGAGNRRRVSESELKNRLIDPHDLKAQALQTDKGLSRFEIYEEANGDLMVYGKGGKGEGTPTGLNLKTMRAGGP